MKRLMYELLSYTPMEYIEGEESQYVKLILGKQQLIPKRFDYYNELYSGFYKYAHEGLKPLNKKSALDANELAWLREWKLQYHGDYDTDRMVYPVLFKKICYYIIIHRDIDDKVLFDAICLKHKMTAEWNIYTRYRRIAQKTENNKLPLNRNGIKQKYLTDAISDMYFECHRLESGVEQSPSKKYSPVFVDCFSGTGAVAASLNIPSEKKVLNEFDRNIMAMLYAIVHHREALLNKLVEYHNEIMNNSFPLRYYTMNDFKNHLPNLCIDAKKKFQFSEDAWRELTYLSEEDMLVEVEKTRRNVELLIHLRNFFGYCLKFIETTNLPSVIDFNDYETVEPHLSKIVEVAACYYFYSSFGNQSQDNTPNRTGVDFDSYALYLEHTFGKMIAPSDRCADVLKTVELKVNRNTLRIHNKFQKSLEDAVMGCLSFEELFIRSDAFYYLDSPYWLTKQYNSKFTDEHHKIMIDYLRTSEFKWIFSMQYFTNKKDANKDKGNRGPVLIKDYYTYYTGFVSEFKRDGDNYVSTYGGEAITQDLYAVVIDESKLGRTKIKDEGNEMFIVNFDTRGVFTYDSGYFQIPFKSFLRCVEKQKTYKQVIQEAKRIHKIYIEGYLH